MFPITSPINQKSALTSCSFRRHFSDWVEDESFTTFHFRHRPEKGNFCKPAQTNHLFLQRKGLLVIFMVSKSLNLSVWLPGKNTGKDVAVAERAVAEEQRQRIDLLQNYSEETCTRVHMPGLTFCWIESRVLMIFFGSGFYCSYHIVQVRSQTSPLVLLPAVSPGCQSLEWAS